MSYCQFWNEVIMKITGAMLYPHRALTELTLHLPPLEVQLEVQTVKFLCKLFTSNENLTATLFQVDGSLGKEFYQQLLALKSYMFWRNPSTGRRRARNIELYDYKERKYYHYDKTTMEKYQQTVWLNKVVKLIDYETSTTNEVLIRSVNRVVDNNIQLNKTINIFNYNTTKKEDSYILDYIHGNSFLFGQCRKRIFNEDTNCYFCNSSPDSPEHQILYCKKLIEQTHNNLVTVLSTPSFFREEIIAPTRKDVQPLFIERIRFLIQQHEALEAEDD